MNAFIFQVRYVAFDKLGHKLITGIANSPQTRWERVRAPVPVPRQAQRSASPYRRRITPRLIGNLGSPPNIVQVGFCEKRNCCDALSVILFYRQISIVTALDCLMLQKGKEGYRLHIGIWCMNMKCWCIDMLECIDLLQWYVKLQ